MASKLAQIDAEAATIATGFDAPLAGEILHVKAMRDWPANILKYINAGDFDKFAEKCLSADSYAAWLKIDPSFAQLEEFLDAVNESTGQNLGK